MRCPGSPGWSRFVVVAFLGAVLPLAGASQPQPNTRSAPAQSHNMRLVGFHDLFARPAYMPHIQQQGTRWILYVAHHPPTPDTDTPQDNGTSILDVTDAGHPAFLAHIPGLAPPNNEARSMRVCERNGRFYLLRSTGQVQFDIYDVNDPAQPRHISTIGGRYTFTHKVNWECETDTNGRSVAYLPVRDPASGWRAPTLMLYDLADPAHPKFIRHFGLPGAAPGSQGAVPPRLHHAIVDRERKRVHIAYGCFTYGTYQIVDRDKLVNGDPADLTSPSLGVAYQPSYWGVHSALPFNGVAIPDLATDQEGVAGKVRDLTLVVGEADGNQCNRPRQVVRFFDVTEPSRATAISSWQVPESATGACSKPGRFGPHAPNESYTEPFYGKLVAIAYFNAGVRMVDIRDPFNLKEVAYYIPAATAKTYYCDEGCAAGAIQTNNAEVDSRGYIYIVDRAGTGMHILELTGDTRKIIE
ncbi:MAG: hypothetical protein AB1806_19535 [Acidobacteriota bacterium]